MDITQRNEFETFQDYYVRLFENKDIYGLSCDDIAELLNHHAEIQKGECAWRKEYAAFNRGRIYERNLSTCHVATRILSLSDFHVPFQKPIETFSEYIGKVDILQLNGDIGDCQAISKFPKTYRISPMEELILARQYLIDLITYLRPKKVVVTYGNHDLRFQNYFSKSLDSDLLELMPKTSLELIFVDGFKHYNKREKTKVEYSPLISVLEDVDIDYTDNWFCQIGQTIFCHPLAFSRGIMKTAEDAMSYFRNEGYNFSSLIMAHTHRLGEYTIGNTTLYEQGCCCNTKENNYSDGRLTKSQIEGFVYLCQDKNGKVIKDKTKLICLSGDINDKNNN